MALPLAREGDVPWTARSLLRDKLRLIISIGGLGFAVLLVLLLRGIMDGTVAKSTRYVDNVGADVFVAREGVTNMALSSSNLPGDLAATLAGIDGVETATGVTRLNFIAASPEANRPAELIGYDPAAGLGGPWKLKSGREVQGPGEAVLDSVLADELGVGLGDEVLLARQPFEVVGLSAESASLAGKLLFIDLGAAQALLNMEDRVSFVLIELEPGVDPDAWVARVAPEVPGTALLTKEQLSDNDRDLLSSLFIDPVNVMATVGFLVGLAIVGLTMYTTTAERIRDFGVLKAIGAPNRFLFRTVLGQAFVLGALGFAVGLVATWIAGPLVVALFPGIGVSVVLVPALQTLGAVLLMSIAGALIPVLRIARVDPLIVFRRA